MSDSIQPRLREFAESVLIRSGALVEWPAGSDAGLAILPPDVAAELHCTESVKLSHQPEAGSLCANLATDFLDRMVPLLNAVPQIGRFQVPELYLKKGDMNEAIGRAFTWHNAKVVARDATPEHVEYHGWCFLASLVSEDRWEDVLSVTINAASRACIRLAEPLSMVDLEPSAGDGQCEPRSTYRAAASEAGRLMERRAAPFVSRLESRLERDRRRLHDYYNALLREENARKHRTGTVEDGEKRIAKRRAVELELRRKLAELDERYAIQAELVPIILIRLKLQALAIHCEVFRKQARKMRIIYWNPLLKELEPLRCHACGRSAFSIAFTNVDVEPLCADCALGHGEPRAEHGLAGSSQPADLREDRA